MNLLNNNSTLPDIGTSTVFAPLTVIGGVMLALGLITMAFGIGLAIYLKKKNRRQ